MWHWQTSVRCQESITSDQPGNARVLKTVLILFLAALSSSALADWAVMYRDVPADKPNKVNGRDAGTRVEIWILRDFVDALSDTRSGMTGDKTDCADEIRRQLYLSWHSGRTGFGQEIRLDSLSTGNWSRIKQGASERVLWKFACEMR